MYEPSVVGCNSRIVVFASAAGDTFIGYFMKSYLDKNTNEVILKISSSASALAISKKGAAKAIPTYDDVILSDIYIYPLEMCSVKQLDNKIDSIMRG